MQYINNLAHEVSSAYFLVHNQLNKA